MVIKQTVDHGYLPPFQGGWFLGRHPGLKPRAESFRPFGTSFRRTNASITSEFRFRGQPKMGRRFETAIETKRFNIRRSA